MVRMTLIGSLGILGLILMVPYNLLQYWVRSNQVLQLIALIYLLFDIYFLNYLQIPRRDKVEIVTGVCDAV